GVPLAGRHGAGDRRHRRRRLPRPARLDLDRVRGHDDRAGRAHMVRTEGALLLRGDGRNRLAVPRDPHRVRHRPRRASRVEAVVARTERTGVDIKSHRPEIDAGCARDGERHGTGALRDGERYATKYFASGWGTM